MTDENNKIYNKFTCRRFIISSVIWSGSFIALLAGKLGGSEFTTVSGLVLGCYSFADVTNKSNILKGGKSDTTK